MSIHFRVLLKSPGLMAIVALGFLILKGAVIYALAKAMDLPFQDRPVFTLLLAQGGEFAFVVFQTASGAKVFPPETASLLIGAVAVRCCSTRWCWWPLTGCCRLALSTAAYQI